MLVPTDSRSDGTIPTITLGLDGLDTEHLKKFKCSICGGTVFGYRDTLKFLLPLDVMHLDDRDKFKEAKALDQIECTHFMFNKAGKRVRCRTLYILLRGKFEVTDG